ncbi:prophage pi2 protein 02 [Lactococcus lactis subsp. lactis]|uniref:SHOCT domain-containing protein n=1 Tax=Lactococcus lactis TaxID=1358 RepID=UPI00071C379A|nr:SHOCT domain-containing protein [Lactococcus lactis]ARE11915.1 SHOCT domain-containing protein [Lactococcus lactis subsp. lactis]KSU32940.1 prophage pi2 protein 02 [Lactococcus lactis subsp. lactis]URL08620.1 SHOCT domain-containing protein [Lactococcus lactis subsp. lactis]
MGFKELLKAKSFNEYFDAKKDYQKMEEIKNRTQTDVLKNAGASLIPSSISNFGFKLSKDSISKGFEKKPLNDVTARLESGSELQARVTMTRLVALGVFAFAAKKKKGGEKYLTIEGPDFVWTAEVKRDKKDIDKAMKFINQVNTNSKIYSKSMQINSSTTSIADELKKFKELLDSGAISQEEFEIQKAKLLK